MTVYVWEGKSSQGGQQKGSVEAANEAAARLLLRKQNIQLVRIKEKPKDILANIALLQPKVTAKDLVLFTRQLSTMIDAGLPLIQGLEILANQEPNKTFQKILLQIKTDVEAGATFADALKKHPKVFDNLYTSLVAAGELGGVLDTILQRLATYIEKNEKLKAKVKERFSLSGHHFNYCCGGRYRDAGLCHSGIPGNVQQSGWSAARTHSGGG